MSCNCLLLSSAWSFRLTGIWSAICSSTCSCTCFTASLRTSSRIITDTSLPLGVLLWSSLHELGECRSHLNALSTCALISSSSLDLMSLRTSAWFSSCCLMSLRRASTSWFVVSYDFFNVKARQTTYGEQHTYPDGRPMKNSEYSSKTEQASILFIPLSTTTQRIEAVNWDLHLF